MEKEKMKKNEKKLIIKKKVFIPLSTEYLRKHKILTEAKIKIIEHPAKKKILIGAKNTGKTLMAEIDALIEMEQNVLAHSFGFRKYKEQASETLGDYFARAINIIEHYGYRTRYRYDQRKNRTYALYDKKNMKKNSYQQYGSIEDPSSTDGKAPANLGYFTTEIVDEPIVKTDMLNVDKIPTQESWNADMEQIDDNLRRYNDAYETMNPGKKAPPRTRWYLMNDYGDHPLSIEARRIISQDEYVRGITGYSMDELLGNKELIDSLSKFDEEDGETILDSKWARMWMENNICAVYDKESDTLVSRMNKFANPNELLPKNAKNNIKMISDGFIRKNFRILAVYAGLQFKAEIRSDMLVYNINNFNHETINTLEKQGYYIEKLGIAIDIDTSRVFTIVPGIKMVRNNQTITGRILRDEKILIDKMIELPAFGSGQFGEAHEMSADMISRAVRKYMLKIQGHLTKCKSSHMVIDDNRKHYIDLLKKRLNGYIEFFTIPIKTGHYEIILRQDYMENAFKEKVLHNHPKNKAFENDVRTTIKVDINSTKRKTSGSTNYLDRIDPTEYVIYLFLDVLIKATKKQRRINYE